MRGRTASLSNTAKSRKRQFNNVVNSLGRCNCFTNLKEVQLLDARGLKMSMPLEVRSENRCA